MSHIFAVHFPPCLPLPILYIVMATSLVSLPYLCHSLFPCSLSPLLYIVTALSIVALPNRSEFPSLASCPTLTRLLQTYGRTMIICQLLSALSSPSMKPIWYWVLYPSFLDWRGW